MMSVATSFRLGIAIIVYWKPALHSEYFASLTLRSEVLKGLIYNVGQLALNLKETRSHLTLLIIPPLSH